ncbi:phosphatase 2C [Coemansia sp. RSA 989]|nr:phosphatase 2C-like domain-containing protein [Coemansia mojavensis]KAJ1742016.1 phosphatase 2C [Coemansia sp. RSA 1086]KAJ1750240.1 phosphatase 2C [Coemansia sp. RSA 1821]KAJ1864735.1 phosphatase 2C [Coemansia sp. RSA 989]KAJ1872272.1 phosphatase 2C [Coemansia sp. RSA 990]KAJ2669301.1 phosphatase 2C [Coemansia sp. RSA 1085]
MNDTSDSNQASGYEDATSPTDDVFDSGASGTATFPNTSAIQPPARLQRSCIPPPIDTENAGDQPASRPNAIEPLALEDTSEQPQVPSTECTHIGVAFSKNRRYRRTMEDAHFHKCDFDNIKGQAFMAIFDGHAGKQAAQWCGNNFANVFLSVKAKHKESVPELLNRTFVEADRQLESDVKTHSGCTAVVAFLEVKEVKDGDTVKRQRTLYCANAGDARAVLSRNGAAKRLTYDHKGDDAREIERISEAGGYVFNGRVNGILAVTRSLGDHSLKQFVIGNPYTTETRLDDNDDVLILACDGLWDVCSDQDAVDLVRDEPDPARASEKLLQHALDNDSMDNITTMVFRIPRD